MTTVYDPENKGSQVLLPLLQNSTRVPDNTKIKKQKKRLCTRQSSSGVTGGGSTLGETSANSSQKNYNYPLKLGHY